MATAQATHKSVAMPTMRKETNLWIDSLRRLVHNRAAVVGGIILLALLFVFIFADLVAIQPYDRQVPQDNNKMPAWLIALFPSTSNYAKVTSKYPMGADDLGRDLWSRVIYGTRISLSVALVGPLLAFLIGTTYGLISGFIGGRVDDVMMRIVDVMYAFPTLLLIIIMMAFFRSSFSGIAEEGTLAYTLNGIDSATGGMLFIFIGIGLTSWMGNARLTRGQVLSVREKEFVEAARSIGSGNRRIMFQHIFPNIIGPIIVYETLAIPGYIAFEAFLSFIGLGVNPPTPSWGIMIADGARNIRTYPHLVLLPALALAVTMFAFNFLGDGMRDALDPRMRGTQ
ncbi:MAG: ABC transporter permease [Chloroflexi bacterium]|nr:ABC transporter permease [Chloroflexota bacterium]